MANELGGKELRCQFDVCDLVDDKGEPIPGMKRVVFRCCEVFQVMTVREDVMHDPAALAFVVAKLLRKTSELISSHQRAFK